jgi:hypothetical protein
LTEKELIAAGVHCDPDSVQPLEDAGVVRRVGHAYELTEAARKILGTFTLAKGPEVSVDVRVDYPEVFVIMPFGQPWSNQVFSDLYKPAIEAAGFVVSRGDTIVRVGDLGTNVWRSITQAGIVVGDVTAPNPNVYYELGLADALGRPTFVFRQSGTTLPADVSGVHFYDYALEDLASARRELTKALVDWAEMADHRFFGVKALAER